MRNREKSGGARQGAWDALAVDTWPTIEALARHLDASSGTLRAYVGALIKRGYVERDEAGYRLVRHTGPRAPAYNVTSDTFRDWNVNPAMSGERLRAIVRSSGLSNAAWLQAHGFDGHGSTRLRQMMTGQRPVSEPIETAALNSLKKSHADT